VIADNGLRESLRTLKLSGMLETLDARLAQARGGELGHLEFLQVLCGDEIARRDQAVFTRRLRRARFDEQVTLTSASPRPAASWPNSPAATPTTAGPVEGFDFAANPKLPAVPQPRGRRIAARPG